ncbi:MAG: 16S rRNA (uracil(1498)-N(3))-methyltransferase [Nocardioides sp.]
MSPHVHLVSALAGARPGSVVTIDGAEAHHAVAVRRLHPGDQVVLTDGAGTSATGEIARVERRRLKVSVLDIGYSAEPEPRLHVVQGLPKGDRGERAVELLTEIGVARITPWAAERCVTAWRGERATKSLERWRATARAATKQSGRSWLPVVDELVGTEEVVSMALAADTAAVLHHLGSDPIAGLDLPASGVVLLIVGPEGGLSDAERRAFGVAGLRSVRMGAEVLRTSTAGVAAAAAILSRTPRWADS